MIFRFIPFLLLVELVLGNPIKSAKSSLWNRRGTSKDQYLVTSLPGLTENIAEEDRPIMFAGQLELYKENNTHYFFWKFADQNRTPEIENRTIFWLNGGPGCSSMDGALMEAGPLRINSNNEVIYNEGSWHKKGDMVFVDQPGGTGFSYTGQYDTELDQIRFDFLTFLEKYFEVFPEDKHKEITLAGESYAGQYIPYIALGILERNKRVSPEEKYNLKGLLIGNGWISPNRQSLSYLPFAVKAGMISTSHPNWQDLLDRHVKCQDLVAGVNDDDTFGASKVVDRVCEGVLNLLLQVTRDYASPGSQECYNMYDYTLKDSYPSCGMNWPPDLPNVNLFLTNPDVMDNINLEHKTKWHECDQAVSNNLKAKNLRPSIVLFPSILQEVPIVLFHGNRDIICNYIGGEDMIAALKWGGQRGFSKDIPIYDWVYDGKVLGYVKSERNLTFVNVFEASHMVPFDIPETSRALMDILYDNLEVRQEEGKKPEMVTYPLGYLKSTTTEDPTNIGVEEPLVSDEASEESSLASGLSTSLESSIPSGNSTTNGIQEESHTSRMVRVIQLAVIVVLVWGICALYNTYKSKPTSIIKTKPSGRKKNVQWADQLEEEEEQKMQPEGFILKALHKLKGTEGYATVPNEDIELGKVSVDDEFIVASDDELDHTPLGATSGERSPTSPTS
ncbi:CIC11C00000000818 [Sungouiella intermedia]|uniref:Carboxypeptidase n=1 Tax=Sungouiella intermedia TaxID=45354 RepID=A0A1L0BQX2_9ASCO|nr:CIC11C00000000818 [[Candida] intermedia]